MLSKDRVNLRRNSNKLYMAIVSFVTLGLMFFLISSFIFEEKLQVLATPINEELEVSSTKNMKIYEWIYDKNKDQMQVIIETNNSLNDFENIQFKAYQQSNGEEINVTKKYRNGSILIVRIDGFDDDYTQIALDVIGENESDNTDEQSNDSTIIKTLYNDYRVIKEGTLEEESETNYLSHISDIIIEDTKKEIKNIEKRIKGNEQDIDENNQRIDELESEKVYQTDQEKSETDSIINGLKIEIDSLKESNDKLKVDIQRLNDKIENTNQRERENLLE